MNGTLWVQRQRSICWKKIIYFCTVSSCYNLHNHATAYSVCNGIQICTVKYQNPSCALAFHSKICYDGAMSSMFQPASVWEYNVVHIRATLYESYYTRSSRISSLYHIYVLKLFKGPRLYPSGFTLSLVLLLHIHNFQSQENKSALAHYSL